MAQGVKCLLYQHVDPVWYNKGRYDLSSSIMPAQAHSNGHILSVIHLPANPTPGSVSNFLPKN